MCILFILCYFPSDSADISASSDPRRPSRGLNLVPRLAVVGGVLLAILADRSSRKQKYLDYDVAPADGVEPPQRPYLAQDGLVG